MTVESDLESSNWRMGMLLAAADLERIGLSLLLTRHAGYFYVPVEAVIRRPGETVWPKQGRFFTTDRFLVDGRIIRYEELSRRPGFQGTYEYNDREITLCEVWSNCGLDGHTSFEHRGWVLLPWKNLKEELEAFEKAPHPRGEVPTSVTGSY